MSLSTHRVAWDTSECEEGGGRLKPRQSHSPRHIYNRSIHDLLYLVCYIRSFDTALYNVEDGADIYTRVYIDVFHL